MPKHLQFFFCMTEIQNSAVSLSLVATRHVFRGGGSARCLLDTSSREGRSNELLQLHYTQRQSVIKGYNF